MSCPICFGGADAATRESLNAGIFVLMGVTLVVLGFFARFFLMLAKRGRESFFEDTRASSSVGESQRGRESFFEDTRASSLVGASVLEEMTPDPIDRRVA
jgi:hypothetical protein